MPENNVIRLAVIGCGAVATAYHIPAIKKVSLLRLSAVVDIDETWVKQVARTYNVPSALADFRQVVGLADAALVATPNASHVEIAAYLLEHGVHVLCEKPLATTASDARLLFDLANRNGTRLMVGQSRRFNPNLTALADLVRQGALGQITNLTAGLGGPIQKWAARTSFRSQRDLAGGGVLMDSGAHLVDLATWLFGESPSEVLCRAEMSPEWNVEMDAEVQLMFPWGGTASLVCSYTHGVDGTVHVQGEAGWAQTSIQPMPELTFYSRTSLVGRRDGVQKVLLPEEDAYWRMHAHFCDCLLTGKPFLVKPEEVIATLQVLDQCYANIGATQC